MLQRGLVQVAERLPGGRVAVAAAAVARFLPPIARTGLFDQEFYELQTGRRFRRRTRAMVHYAANYRATRAAPNPLMEPEWPFPDQRGRHCPEPIRAWTRRSPESRGQSTGPLFDAERYLRRHPEAADHRGGPLGHFLTHAAAEDPLPVPGDHLGPVPTWGQAREALLAKARELQGFGELRSGRRSDQWDTAADPGFIRRWAGAAPATAPGEPLVTVVMPVRNRPVQVTTAIASVRAQTLTGWELIVVDDGSTDDTAAVVAALAAEDPRIRLVTIPPSGVCKARNTALSEGRGRFAAFLDSDNEWLPHFLAVMTGYLDGNGLSAGYCVVDNGPGEEKRYLAHRGGLDHLLVKNHVDLNALLVDRRLALDVGGFDENLRRWVDHDLVLRVARRTEVPLVPFVGVAYDHDLGATDRITTRESDHWQYVALGKNVVRWEEVEQRLPERVPGRVSISMPTYQDWSMTIRAVRRVLEAADTDGDDVEVVVIDNGSRRAVSAVLAAAFLTEPRVRVVSLPRNLHFAIGSNLGFALSTGETVVFLNNDTEVSPGWLAPLVRALQDPEVTGAQPLLLYPDGSIQSAGTTLLGGDLLPTPFLVNHAPEDAERAAPIRLRVATAAALAMRAHDVVALRGFDPIFVNGFEDVDLCLRAVERSGGRFAVVTDSVVMHHESKTPGRNAVIHTNRALWFERWQGRLPDPELELYHRAGFEVAHLDPGRPVDEPHQLRMPRPVLVRKGRTVAEGPAAGLPSLRWAIKIAAHPGPRGDSWGDVHFARSLARALERLGQDVVVDRRESHQRPTSYLDDVVLTLRGLDDVAPHPGRVNLLWVISHPELVGDAELRRYDQVFAASLPWSERVSQRTGVPVRPMLQATDPEVFNPALPPGPEHEVLFVGNSRRVFRPIVRDALAVGVPLAVYGQMWEPYGLGEHWVGTGIPNRELGRAYAGAQVVLCDHWADMATEGFISNRIFDALACGARVVSDPVPGLADLFDGAVREYRHPQDLARLCGPERTTAFPETETRLKIAEYVLREHSFDARARQLLDAALDVRSRSVWPRP